MATTAPTTTNLYFDREVDNNSIHFATLAGLGQIGSFALVSWLDASNGGRGTVCGSAATFTTYNEWVMACHDYARSMGEVAA